MILRFSIISLLLVGNVVLGSSSNRDGPLADVKIVFNSKRTWYGGFALNGGTGSTDYVSGTTLKTIEGDGCDNTQYSSADVFFVQRGNCTFAEKALLAKRNGGKLVIVGNNVPSLYSNTTTGIVKDACELDCEESSSDVQSQCEAGCSSNICIPDAR